jgi:hypothetical protein
MESKVLHTDIQQSAYKPALVDYARSSLTVADIVREYRSRPYVGSLNRAEAFDCVTFINELTGAEIDGEWMDEGGDLPFRSIPLSQARPGDLLVFNMPWSTHRWHVALMTDGLGADDMTAKLFGPYFGHAACECWIAPMWRKYLVGAYRVEMM